MPKVNFYLLKDPSEEARRLFACRLAEQLNRQGVPVQFAVTSEEEAQQLDKLLWSYAPESFLPHALVSAPEAEQEKILIGAAKHALRANTLLNLTDDIPPQHASCTAIAEFILNDEEAKARSRQQWQQYKQLGYELQLHQL